MAENRFYIVSRKSVNRKWNLTSLEVRMMIKKFTILLLSAVVATTYVGCKKQQTTLEQPTLQKPDSSFQQPLPLNNVDTSDNVSFKAAELDAEFERQVQQNLLTLHFDYNSYALTADSKSRLETAGAFLMSHPTVRVLIEGHCDERGSADYNMGLGENRARSVKSFLNTYGIPGLQIEVTSWGKERPIRTGCEDDACHYENRRAEYKVLSK
jgi:peptidoglycan-associated lipoprotein